LFIPGCLKTLNGNFFVLNEFKDFLNAVPGLSQPNPVIPGDGGQVLEVAEELMEVDEMDLENPGADPSQELADLAAEFDEFGEGPDTGEDDDLILGPVQRELPLARPTALTYAAERYYMDIRDGFRITARGRLFVEGAHVRYQILHGYLVRHAAIYGEVDLFDVSDKWLKGFVHFLHHQNLSLNTVAGYVDNLHAMLRNYATDGLLLPKLTVRVHPEASNFVYNSEDELEMLLNAGFSHQALAIARDIFVMQSYLGFRVATLQKFLREPQLYLLQHKDRWLIHIRTNKTGALVTVPVKRIILQILQRWNYSFEPAYYERYYNVLIKMMAREAGLTRPVAYSMMYGNKRKEFRDEKWELMASHTARRNFATNAYLAGVPVEHIMRITGHTTREAFMRYIRCESIEVAIAMLQHKYFS
jgi:hypothetical protein